MNVPIQVSGRIVDVVGPEQAAAMAGRPNVRAVIKRRTGAIVRLIIEPHTLGSDDEPAFHESSLQTVSSERLFLGETNTTSKVYSHKPSGIYKQRQSCP